jgi:Protein of unknown function (DUF2637)
VPRSSSPPSRAAQPGRVLRGVALTSVSAGVLVLAAAAFVLSYSGIHAVARQAGISATLARGYPVILDAMLIVACAAILALRGAGWFSKVYAWLSLLVLLGAAAGAGALHSTGTAIPHRGAAAAAAVIPWVLLLIGFGLLLAILRHFRLHRAPPSAPPARLPARAPGAPLAALPAGQGPAAPAQAAIAPQPAVSPPAVPPAVPPPAVSPPGVLPPAAAPAPPVVAVPAQPPAPAAESSSGQASPGQASPGQASPGQADTGPAGTGPAAGAAGAWPDEPDPAYLDADADDLAAAGAEIYAAPPAEDDDPPAPAPDEPRPAPAPDEPRPAYPAAPQPAFHRMWSSPTPPGEDDDA